jgi:hypothetical protein
MIAWLRKLPVAIFLLLQAFLCLWRLNLLAPWGDEVTSLHTVQLDVPHLVAAAAKDIHPPLYYLLLHFWQGLPLGLDAVLQARLLSVLFLLGATVAVERFWARKLPGRGRVAFLAIWTLSPCLLLYGRMCRSYSLQLLTAILAAACIRNYAEQRTRKFQALLAVSLAVALYTHYVPGIALLAAANLMLIQRLRWRDAAEIDAVVVLAYLPWMGWLWQSLARWGNHPESYFLTGTSIYDLPVKLAYWLASFTLGESQPDLVLLAGILLILAVLWLAAVGTGRDRVLAWIAIPATLIGIVGVGRWVSYPFLPARLLFTYPFLLLLAVQGGQVRRRLGQAVCIATIAASVVGIGCYFQKSGFRNKEYPLPVREITAYIERYSTPADSLVLVDSTNSDPQALAYALAGSRTLLETTGAGAPQALDRFLADPNIRSVWFLRNTHDISVYRLDDQFDRQLRAAMTPTVHSYERFSPLETWVIRRIGIDPPPAWFTELLEFRRPTPR